jgi:hypothetical protein
MIKNFDYTVDGSKVTITSKCKITKKPVTLVVPLEGFLDYFDRGVYVQHAFPTLNADDREFLISGVSLEGWTQLYGKEE